MNSSFISVSSPNPAHREDKLFFDAHPERAFRARPYMSGDAPFLESVSLFAAQNDLLSGEISLVIIKRIQGGRARRLFAVSQWPPLDTDEEIRNFLQFLNVNPDTFVGRQRDEQ
ncbi:hypothetical protein [Methylobacterium goesingense]|uniref:Uncharacterized protein n=1 Tax=Methylobacterium goesingense TaxID=243690 RepID=A0ABV2L9P0_9HYPH|nr:hypothetical protein [Methylobacterium goesingense]